jgi:hypothetical protein
MVGGAEEPFADVGAEKSAPARHKGRDRSRHPVGWRFFVIVGGAAACSWLAGVVVICWGRGLGAFLGAATGSVAGSVCLGFFGALFGGAMWLYANKAARVTKDVAGAFSGKPGDQKLAVPVMVLVALMFAGFLLTAPCGALVGAVGGSSMTDKPENAKKKSAKQREADDARLGYAVLAAGGGAVLGAVPGAIVVLLVRLLPAKEEKREQAKRS